MPPGLTPSQREALAAAIDRIVPSDESGPGAVELGVVEFAERAIGEASRPEAATWLAGLDALDACAGKSEGAPFAALPERRRDALLDDFERGRAGSALADEPAFFELLRDHVLQGMFGDPAWGGNRGGGGWELLGFAGPRLVWTASEQQLDVVPGAAGEAAAGGSGSG